MKPEARHEWQQTLESLMVTMKQLNKYKQKLLSRILLFAAAIIIVGQGSVITSGQETGDVPATVNAFETPEELSRELKQRGWKAFTKPLSTDEKMGLDFAAGYQPGKIPVVFIHGLLSDPLTWHDTISALSLDTKITDKYQFWTYRYPTGETYLKAAADLRTALTKAKVSFDPDGSDAALNQMVLIGHSMGGLVAKLQITRSEQKLWEAFCKVPISELSISAEDRSELERIVLFEPLPFVDQVIFIATPHGGSSVVHRVVGKVARLLIEFPETVQTDFDDFLDENKGAFKAKSTKIPTSLDHLSPKSSIMIAIQQLEIATDVELYSIIGTGTGIQALSRGDGAVSRKSATLSGVIDETLVPAKHVDVHHHPVTIEKIKRILNQNSDSAKNLKLPDDK